MTDLKGVSWPRCLAVLLVCVVSMCGCSFRSTRPPSTAEGAVDPVKPLSPPVLRRLLVDDPGTFREAFDALSETDVQQIASAVSSIPGEAIDLKALLVQAVPLETKRQVLRLAEQQLVIDDKPYDTAMLRARLVGGLGDDRLRRMAENLSQAYRDRQEFCRNKRPRIHNIGLQSILTFEQKKTTDAPDTPVQKGTVDTQGLGPARRAVRIPIDGRDLHPRCVTVRVLITGTVPLNDQPWGNEFRVTFPSESLPDNGNVVLQQPFIERLKTGDQVTVQVAVSQPAGFTGSDRDRVVSVATRTFTVYEIEDYRRQVLGSRIRAHDISAFPLPETNAEMLFGSLIAREFYVVRLSVRNTDSEAKLISTGMIRANGRAIVEPTGEGETSFTVPITVVPSSMQQTYTTLDDEEPNQPRAVIFRALEFTGALASAATAAFGVPVNVLKIVGLFTGVGIPEGKRLFPDRWPGYKRNVVTYGMPDLLKVPANAVGDHKFLFFAKRNLEGIISDQNLFHLEPGDQLESLNRTHKILPGEKNRIGTSPPAVRVISVAFDNLDVRFEKVFDIAKLTARQRVGNLLPAIQKQIDVLSVLDSTWASDSNEAVRFGEVLSVKTWKEVDTLLRAVLGSFDQAAAKVTLDDRIKQKVHNLLAQMAAISQSVKPNTGGLDGFRKDLVLNADFGLRGLRALLPRVNQLAAVLVGGADVENESDVKKIEDAVSNSQKASEFYMRAVQVLASADIVGATKELKTTADAVVGMQGDQIKAKKAFADAATKFDTIVSRHLGELSGVRPNGVLKLMMGVDWPSLGPVKAGG